MEEGLEIGASGAVAFFDSDALKPLAAACLLAPAAEQWSGLERSLSSRSSCRSLILLYVRYGRRSAVR